MHPLPNCASGEWGPTKARRHLGLEPLSHTSGLINVETVVELRLRQPRPLQYVFRLHFNDYEDALLKRSVYFPMIVSGGGKADEGGHTPRAALCGAAFGGAKIWNSEIWPPLANWRITDSAIFTSLNIALILPQFCDHTT